MQASSQVEVKTMAENSLGRQISRFLNGKNLVAFTQNFGPFIVLSARDHGNNSGYWIEILGPSEKLSFLKFCMMKVIHKPTGESHRFPVQIISSGTPSISIARFVLMPIIGHQKDYELRFEYLPVTKVAAGARGAINKKLRNEVIGMREFSDGFRNIQIHVTCPLPGYQTLTFRVYSVLPIYLEHTRVLVRDFESHRLVAPPARLTLSNNKSFEYWANIKLTQFYSLRIELDNDPALF